MQLITLRSLWTNGFDLDGALCECREGHFDGVEGPLPEDIRKYEQFAAKVLDAGVPFVAEITTGGGYVPTTRVLQMHLEDFARKITAAGELRPLFATVLAGSDAWSLDTAVDFIGRAMEIAATADIVVSFETHRSRFTYSPWQTAELIARLPSLRLTCDFSHWCCVCERLVLNEEPGLLELFASRAHHVHARVGYDQGPQVAHPAAPEYRSALESHEAWWLEIWRHQLHAGCSLTTLTPEFGPDGYQQRVPFTGESVACLDEINHWMAAREREKFSQVSPSLAA
jgi:hypothetical protein